MKAGHAGHPFSGKFLSLELVQENCRFGRMTIAYYCNFSLGVVGSSGGRSMGRRFLRDYVGFFEQK